MDKIEMKNIISDVAKLAIRDYLDITTERSEKSLGIILDELQRTILKSSMKSSIFEAKLQILKVLNYKDMMYEKGDLSPLL